MAGRTDAAAAAADAAPAAVVATIDPCDPKRMMFDSLDLLAYEIITNPSKRMERKGQLEVRAADVIIVRASPLGPLACGYWYLFHSLCSMCNPQP